MISPFDLARELAQPYSARQLERLVTQMETNEALIQDLVAHFISASPRTTALAGATLSNLAGRLPGRVAPYLPALVAYLSATPHPAARRNILRLLQYVSLPGKLQGKVADLCFAYVQNPWEPDAVRAYAITVLANLCQQQPELGRELRLVLEEQMLHSKPSFQVRAKLALRHLEQSAQTFSFRQLH